MAVRNDGVVGRYTLGGMGADDLMVGGGASRIFVDRELSLNVGD